MSQSSAKQANVAQKSLDFFFSRAAMPREAYVMRFPAHRRMCKCHGKCVHGLAYRSYGIGVHVFWWMVCQCERIIKSLR